MAHIEKCSEEKCELSQWTTTEPRKLSNTEVLMLEKQNSKLVSEFKEKKLEAEAQKMWDLFYKRNSTNFFKDRHWTAREFEEINLLNLKGSKSILLEAGCGVGNAIFPIIKQAKDLFVFACDFSPRAVQYVKEHESYDLDRCSAFQCDLSSQDLLNFIPANTVDIATLIFVLSAIHPDKFLFVLKNIHKVLKPNGLLLFRDYGIYDWAMLRFNSGSKISENFYVRQDGTRAYYFKKEQMDSLAFSAGYDICDSEYVMRETVNKKKDLKVPRIFLQGKYKKR